MSPSRRAPRRIAIVTSGLGAGGAEQVIAQIARHWSDADHDVEIVTFDRPGDLVFNDFPAGVTLHRLGVQGVARRVTALRLLLARRKPDLVVSFLTKINLVAALACMGTGIRLICSERNNPERQQAHPLWNVALRAAYRRADAIVCQTDAVRRCFTPALRGRLVTIANPVPLPDVARPAEPGTRISAVGRLTHQKGFDRLLNAFATLARRHPTWTLDIWGEGPDRAALEARIGAFDLTGRVHLRGLSPQPRSWVGETDIFVLSSRYEGFPNALGEAMAAGLPVVAMDCDFGPADMVDHGRSGLLVAEDSDAALAEQIEVLIADPELRERLGRGARIAMDRFRAERILRQWDAVLARSGEVHIARSSVPAVLEGR